MLPKYKLKTIFFSEEQQHSKKHKIIVTLVVGVVKASPDTYIYTYPFLIGSKGVSPTRNRRFGDAAPSTAMKSRH
jgi:hypothetical protein